MKLQQSLYAFLITLLYIAVFLFADNVGISVASIKQKLSNLGDKNTDGKYELTGPDTYRLNFTKKSTVCADCDSTGLLVKGGKNYSPGFEIKIHEVFSDSLSVIRTQAKIRRNSTDSLHFLFVVTIETPGVEKTYWNASYGLNADFDIEKSTILNGRLKVDDFPVNENSVLKAYIWNVGEADIHVEFIELSFGTDPAPKGNETLIQQMEGDYLQPKTGYQPYLPKTKVIPGKSDFLKNVKELKSECLFTYRDQLHCISKSAIHRLNEKGILEKHNYPAALSGSITVSGCDENGRLFVSKRIAQNKLLLYYPFESKTMQLITIGIPVGKWIISESDQFETGMQTGWINQNGQQLLCAHHNSYQLYKCSWKSNFNIQQISALHQISTDVYVAFVKKGESEVPFIGKLTDAGIQFNEFLWSDPVHKNVIMLSAKDEFLPMGNSEFLIAGQGWRHALHLCKISENGKITVLESYFPMAEKGGLPPFYYEELQYALWKKNERSFVIKSLKREGNAEKMSTVTSIYSISTK